MIIFGLFYQPCTPSASGVGDGIDNDCDGLIDEEACWDSNTGEEGRIKIKNNTPMTRDNPCFVK